MRIAFLLLCLLLCTTQCSNPEKETQVDNLSAFAKTYGYLRFFHPSDESQEADWNKVLVKSIDDVLNSSKRGLKQNLENNFRPIAPMLQILSEGTSPIALPRIDSTGNLVTIAWYHNNGPRLDQSEKRGMSRRIGRHWLSERDIASAYQMMHFPVEVGQDFELELKIKVSSEDSLYIGQTMIQVNEQKKEILLEPSDWQTINFKGTMDKKSSETFVIIRLFPSQKCTVQIDDIKLAIEDSAGQIRRAPIYNHKFDQVRDSLPKHWELTNNRNGHFSAQEENKENTVLQFEKTVLPTWQEHPQYGEHIHEKIGQGLSCFMPLALWGNSNETISIKKDALLERYLAELDKIQLEDIPSNSLVERLSNVILIWNIVQHFYPEKADKIQWDNQLSLSLNEAFDESISQKILLQKMLLPLGGRENWIGLKNQEYSYMPAIIRLVENQFVVVESDIEALKKGDIILEKDGKNQEKEYERLEQFLPMEKPEKRRWFAQRIERTINAEPKQKATLTIKRGPEIHTIEVPISSPENIALSENRPDIKTLENGIQYINIANTSIGAFRHNLSTFKQAKGLVIDMRGTSKLNVKDIFPYFSKDTIPHVQYEYAATFYPNQEKVIWRKSNTPKQETKTPSLYLDTPKIFLVDEHTAYYFDHMARWFKHKKEGLLVGSPTLGISGASQASSLLGDWNFYWSSFRITSNDGKQKIQQVDPDILVESTIKDILDDRDPVLEKAIELLSKKELSNQIQ